MNADFRNARSKTDEKPEMFASKVEFLYQTLF